MFPWIYSSLKLQILCLLRPRSYQTVECRSTLKRQKQLSEVFCKKRCFPVNLAKFLRTPFFCRTTPDDCFLPVRDIIIYSANNEQASFAVFTAVFCFTHAEHHLIKLKLYNNNWAVQAVNSVLCEIQRKQSNLFTFKNWPINQRWKYMW